MSRIDTISIIPRLTDPVRDKNLKQVIPIPVQCVVLCSVIDKVPDIIKACRKLEE